MYKNQSKANNNEQLILQSADLGEKNASVWTPLYLP